MEADKGKGREKHKPTVPIIPRPGPKPPPVPEDFGDYRIIEEHGCGGMGWILKAVHKKLDVVHALKILHSALSRHEEFVTNFKREAQLAAKLQYPNIVTIHNTGEFAGFHYIAMEFIDGVNLAKALPEKGIEYPVVLAIAVKILDALDHAHNYEFSYQGQTYYGMIHRDIKPENIIVEKSTGEVKITDFGIARGIHLYGDVTTEGTIVGTPSYMSPEQIDGTQKISHTTDIYSLGVLMYELLSGKKAFDGSTTQIIRRISNHEYEPLSRAGKKVPAEIIKIVDKAMSFDPEDRFQSAFEMREAISKYLSQFQYEEPTALIRKYFVERITPPPKPTKIQRRPGRVLARTAKVLGVLAVIFIIGLGSYYAYKAIIRHKAQNALALFDEKLKRSQENYASLDFAYPLELYNLANERFLSKDYKGTRALCDSGAAVADDIIREYRINAINNKYSRVSQRIDQAKELGSEIEFSQLYLIPAQNSIDLQEWDEADVVLDKAITHAGSEIARLRPRPPPPEPDRELAGRKLAEVKERLAEVKATFPDTSFSDAEVLIAAAENLFGRGQWPQTLGKVREAEEAIRKKIVPGPPAVCPTVEAANGRYDSLSNEQKEKLGHEWRRMNELAEIGRCQAADVFANMILEEEVPGERPAPPEPVVPEEELTDSAHFVRGTNSEANGDLESALKHYQEVKPADSKQKSWKYYLPARFRMGVIHQGQKQYKEAIAAYREVLSLRKTNYYPTCYLNIGVCFFQVSSYDSAIASFEELERYRSLIVPDPNKGETTVYHTDIWHDAMYYWALSLTKLYYGETDPQKKKELREEAIRKWENDYISYIPEFEVGDHPRRKEYFANGRVYLKNLKLEG